MIVVCENDFPVCVLPATTTMEQARAFCAEKQQTDPRNQEMLGSTQVTRVFWNAHDVPEVSL